MRTIGQVVRKQEHTDVNVDGVHTLVCSDIRLTVRLIKVNTNMENSVTDFKRGFENEKDLCIMCQALARLWLQKWTLHLIPQIEALIF